MAMKNGRYAMQFRADGMMDSGVMSVAGPHADGQGERFSVHGHLMNAGPHLIASMTVATDARAKGDPFSEHAFTVAMRGVAAEGHFSLRGYGPLGVVVEIIAIEITDPKPAQSYA
jgi:hypothetical protein